MSEDRELTWLPGWRIRELCIQRRLSPVEVARHFLERIERLEPALHAFVTLTPELALEQARAAERELQGPGPFGPLFAVPVSIKDLFHTRGVRTTGGSLLYRDFVPDEDSAAVARLREAGAVMPGKTNTPEFGLAGRTFNRIAEETLNPWDTRRTPGGSSGGAAAGVAAGMGPMALGSDAAGSIRVPASFCGVYGVYPSLGRVSGHGGFGGTLFFSGTGPITRDVRDAAIMLQVLAVPDPADPTCRKDVAPDYLQALEDGVRGLRLAWVADFRAYEQTRSAVVETVRRAASRFGEIGAEVEELPPGGLGFAAEEVAEAFWTILDGDRQALIGEQLYADPATRGMLTSYVRDRFASARDVTAVSYVHALRARFRLIDALERAYERYDLILTPTVASVAPIIDANASLSGARDQHAYSSIISLSGFAAASLPCGYVDGLPVGLQIIGRPNREDLVLRASRAFEQLQPWADAHPPTA